MSSQALVKSSARDMLPTGQGVRKKFSESLNLTQLSSQVLSLAFCTLNGTHCHLVAAYPSSR